MFPCMWWNTLSILYNYWLYMYYLIFQYLIFHYSIKWLTMSGFLWDTISHVIYKLTDKLHNKNIHLFLNQALVLLSSYVFAIKYSAYINISNKRIYYEAMQLLGLMNIALIQYISQFFLFIFKIIYIYIFVAIPYSFTWPFKLEINQCYD